MATTTKQYVVLHSRIRLDKKLPPRVVKRRHFSRAYCRCHAYSAGHGLCPAGGSACRVRTLRQHISAHHLRPAGQFPTAGRWTRCHGIAAHGSRRRHACYRRHGSLSQFSTYIGTAGRPHTICPWCPAAGFSGDIPLSPGHQRFHLCSGPHHCPFTAQAPVGHQPAQQPPCS